MIRSRDEIKDFILEIEGRFPVNEWSLNGFYFWPIIRIRLFFYLIRQVEYQINKEPVKVNKTQEKKGNRFLRKLRKLFSFLHAPLWMARLPRKKYLFIAQDAHRVNYRGKRFNRFFDILIKKYALENDCMYFEKTLSPANQIENGSLLFDYEKALQAFVKRYRMKSNHGQTFDNSSYREFLVALESNAQTKGFIANYTEKRLSKWYERTAVPKMEFFRKILDKIQPEQITILCYYSENIMLLVAAANALQIKTVEMQHGPQSPLHLCYASWNQIPTDGYQVLPRSYWCWDASSKQTIDAWATSSTLYNALHVGSPWIDFWRENGSTFSKKSYILYSLQPKPVSLEQLFSEQIINLMKELKMPWFIRLHPRQLNDVGKIKKLLEDKGVLKLAHIDAPTEAPLPQLLANASLHVTHYSGTAIEATQMQTRTVLLHPIGEQSFYALIKEGWAVYLNPENEDFIAQFKTVLLETNKNDLPENRYSTVKDLF